MNKARIWMKWMSALTITIATAACGTTILEPIRADESESTATPIPPTMLVKDLSPQDAEAWCTWYVDTFAFSAGQPRPASGEVADGYTCRGAFTSVSCGDQPTSLCAVRPSIEQCVQNLQRKPCEAPMSELDACARSLITQSSGAGGFSPCGDQCAAFRARVDCEETVAQELQNAPPDGSCSNPGSFPSLSCRLPVD